MTNKKYSLAIEKIDEAVQDFFASHRAYSVNIKECNKGKQKQIEVVGSKNKSRGILNCYITGGQVSHNIQGGNSDLNLICKDCWEYIIEQTALPATDQKCFTVHGVKHDDFDALIEAVKEYNDITVTQLTTENNPNIRNQYHLKGKYDAKISVIFYINGTLMIQGCITSFYVEFVTDVLQIVSSVPSEMIEDVFSLQSRVGYAINEDMNFHISNMEHIRGSVMESFIKTSICLANSGVKVDDYGCYTFGVMKALDAIMRTRFLQDTPDFGEYRTYFQKNHDGTYCFKECIVTYDNNRPLKRALEYGYSFFNQHRHSTFHVDDRNIETSRILKYDDAINIIKESFVIIDRICKNW